MKDLIKLAAATIVFTFIFSLIITASLSTRHKSQAAPPASAELTPTPAPAPTPSLNPVLYHPQLEADYLNMINEVNHNYYNYVTTGIKKSKGGYTLWAYHSFFGQYEFEIGNFGKEVSAWISKNYTILKRGKITRVGVHGTGPYASYTYFDVN